MPRRDICREPAPADKSASFTGDSKTARNHLKGPARPAVRGPGARVWVLGPGVLLSSVRPREDGSGAQTRAAGPHMPRHEICREPAPAAKSARLTDDSKAPPNHLMQRIDPTGAPRAARLGLGGTWGPVSFAIVGETQRIHLRPFRRSDLSSRAAHATP